MARINSAKLSQKLLNDLTSNRKHKIDSIKHKLTSGSYNIKSAAVAKAIFGISKLERTEHSK